MRLPGGCEVRQLFAKPLTGVGCTQDEPAGGNPQRAQVGIEGGGGKPCPVPVLSGDLKRNATKSAAQTQQENRQTVELPHHRNQPQQELESRIPPDRLPARDVALPTLRLVAAGGRALVGSLSPSTR